MRRAQSGFVRKEDLIYTPTQGVSDGFSGGLQIAANDRRLATQILQAAVDIQNSEDELRRSIAKQQNDLLLLNAKNKLSQINQEAYLALQRDPDQFKIQTNEQASKVINELPLLLRDKAKTDFLQEQNGYYYKARNNQREYLDKQKFEQIQVSNKNLAKFSTYAIQNMFSVNSADQAQGVIDLGIAIGNFEMSLLEKSGLGTDLFTEKDKYSERQGFYGSVFEQFARLKLSSISDPVEAQAFINEVQNGSAQITYKDPLSTSDVSIPSVILDQKTRNTISRGLKSRLKENIKLQAEAQADVMVQEAIEGKIHLDPKDSKTRDAVSKHYEKYIAPNVSYLNPLESLNIIGSYLNKTNVMPKSLESNIRGWLASDDFMAVSFASDIIKNISVNNLDLIDYIPSKDIAKALTMNRMTNAGIGAEEAFNTITKSFATVSEDIKQQRTRSFNKELNDNKEDFEASVMESGWFWWKENKAPTLIVADEFYYQFTDLARDFYVMGSDFETAKQSALACMKKRWGNSVVNGDDILTALPPEKYYSDYNLTGKVMRSVLLDVIENKPEVLDLPEDLRKEYPDINKFMVLADRATYATAGSPTSKPSYALCYKNDMGVPTPILGKDLSIVRIGENIWNKESRFEYEKKQFKGKKNRHDIDLIELFEGEEF